MPERGPEVTAEVTAASRLVIGDRVSCDELWKLDVRVGAGWSRGRGLGRPSGGGGGSALSHDGGGPRLRRLLLPDWIDVGEVKEGQQPRPRDHGWTTLRRQGREL
jgi:hypothetical protein